MRFHIQEIFSEISPWEESEKIKYVYLYLDYLKHVELEFANINIQKKTEKTAKAYSVIIYGSEMQTPIVRTILSWQRPLAVSASLQTYIILN